MDEEALVTSEEQVTPATVADKLNNLKPEKITQVETTKNRKQDEDERTED